MKRIYTIALAAVCLASCRPDIFFEVTYDVRTASTNTYLAGEPVRFNFTGDVDNLVFFSGEPGHEYQYKDRYEVSVDEIDKIDLQIDFQPRWGSPGALDLYVSDSFEGLSGTDGQADRQTIREMVDGGLQGWTRLEYTDGTPQTWSTGHYDISGYMKNFSIAFHWHPEYTGTLAQRTYWLNGLLSLSFPGAESSLTFKDLDFVSVLMNEELDPYLHAGNGSIIIGGYQSEINFQGAGATEAAYALEGWCISKPMALNKVAADTGVVIKNLENDLSSFEYVYKEPGVYKATFLGINDNIAGNSSKIKQINIVIL